MGNVVVLDIVVYSGDVDPSVVRVERCPLSYVGTDNSAETFDC
jgi:hypothetical protein